MTLNLQGKLITDNGKPYVTGGIEWVKQVRPDGSEVQGYTANPVGGCFHRCTWTMPDGQVAECYADTVAHVMTRAYPQGFEHHYWRPDMLREMTAKLKRHDPCTVFINSMSDLFGSWVPADQTQAVLDFSADLPHITFVSLTKNAPRLLKFKYPANWIVGASMPPDSFMGKPLTPMQQRKMLEVSLKVLSQVQARTVMSFEPLSWDVSDIVADHSRALNWAFIGAASRGRTYYQPNPDHVWALELVLDAHKTPVFYKGNLKRQPRREEFPL